METLKAVLVVAFVFALYAFSGYGLFHLLGMPIWWGFWLAGIAYAARLAIGVKAQIEKERQTRELIQALQAYEKGLKQPKARHLAVVPKED